jgi:sigma-B regulation protein RsbU (phosphoserine phosphatase)
MPNGAQTTAAECSRSVVDVVRAIHSCWNVEQIRECVAGWLDAGRRESFSVLLLDSRARRLQVFLAGHDGSWGSLAADTTAWLLDLTESCGESLTAVPGERRLAAGDPPITACAVLSFHGERHGLLLLHNVAPGAFERWQPVVGALASELVKAQVYEAANRESATKTKKLEALREAGELIRFVDLDVLLARLMELSLEIVRAQVGAIVLLEEGVLHTGVEWGLSEEVLLSLRTPEGEPWLRTVIERGEPVRIGDSSRSSSLDAGELQVHIQSLLAIPLVARGNKLGAIVLVNGEGGELDEAGSDVLATMAGVAATALQNAMLYRRAIEHERISAEMAMASQLQTSLLPASPPRVPGLELAGWNIACSETCGDYYDFLDMGEGRIGIVVGDATGHGMGAALLMFIVRSTLRALLTRDCDLAQLVETMNTLVEEASESSRFMTLFFGIADRAAAKLTYVNAGHDPPLVFSGTSGEFRNVEGGGVPLGILPRSRYEASEVELVPGDLWLFGTDGIWEARNARGEFYGKERLQNLIRSATDKPVDELSRGIRDDLHAFHDGAEQRDDITAVFMRVR